LGRRSAQPPAAAGRALPIPRRLRRFLVKTEEDEAV